MWAMTYAGEAKEAARRHPDLLQKAREHNDLFAILNFGTTVAAFANLSEDQPEELREHLQEDKARLSERGFFVQHHNWLLASAFLEMYEGNGQAAWDVIGDHWPGYRASFLSRVQQIRIDFWQTRARAALAAAEKSRQPSRLLAAAQRDARRLRRENAPWASALAQLIQAGVDARRGERGRAIERLPKASAALLGVDMKLFAAAANVRLGRLLADEAGKQLGAMAKAEMTRLGVRDPERMTRALAPGFDDAKATEPAGP
jgi:hypothetical protein